jgi:hypothetical protein
MFSVMEWSFNNKLISFLGVNRTKRSFSFSMRYFRDLDQINFIGCVLTHYVGSILNHFRRIDYMKCQNKKK